MRARFVRGARLVVQLHPEGINTERRAKRQHEEIECPQPEHGKPSSRAIAAEFAAGPGVCSPASQQGHGKDGKGSGRQARGHLVASRLHANSDRPQREKQHRHAQQQADGTPGQLQDSE